MDRVCRGDAAHQTNLFEYAMHPKSALLGLCRGHFSRPWPLKRARSKPRGGCGMIGRTPPRHAAPFMNTSHKITPFQALACPLDGAPLQRDASTWRCAAGHCFDIASQGYANLLPVQQKRSRDPGDSKEMVAARQRFLNAGFYEPIAAATRRAALAELPATALASCLDAGCGEGYYLRQLAAAASAGGQALALLGLDISKWAVLAAARQDKRANWVVGSNAKLPAFRFTPSLPACSSQAASCCKWMPGRIICANCAKSSIPP